MSDVNDPVEQPESVGRGRTHFDFTDAVVLVTGGGTGIGLAIATASQTPARPWSSAAADRRSWTRPFRVPAQTVLSQFAQTSPALTVFPA